MYKTKSLNKIASKKIKRVDKQFNEKIAKK